jgi:hypothetical protein
MMSSVKMYNAPWANSNEQLATICGNVTNDARVFVSKSDAMTLSYSAIRTYAEVEPFSVAISFTYGKNKLVHFET